VSALILDEPGIWDSTHIQWAYDYITRCHELTSTGKTAAELREILVGVENAEKRQMAFRLSQLDPGPLEAWFDRSIWEGFKPETMLKDISCPTLLIHGNPEIDWASVLTKEQAELIVSAIPDCVSDYWDDAGHGTHFIHSMRFVGVVTQFLESLER
jgi:pimeloyl-ACP methyl ester carboxylesterase